MIKYSLLLFILLTGYSANSQQIDWVISNPVNYSLNPGLVYQTLEASPNGNIICSRMDTSHLVYNSNVYGRTIIECLDPTGHVLWNYVLSDSVVVHHIFADANNRIYIGGRFLGTAILNGTDTMFNSSALDYNEDEFILKFGPGGTLLWKRNLSVNSPLQRLTAFTCDQQNSFWFCTSDFMDSRIFKTNNAGDITDSVVVHEAKSVSGISFDTFGSLYICGSVGMGFLTIDSSQFSVPDSYMMYIARLNSSFGVEWIHFAHDITFQSPQLVSDLEGGVFFAGNFYDSLTWGNLTFPHPQWNNDFFLVRADSLGNFQWGRNFHASPTITGRFSIASPGKFIETDPAGNVLLLGTLNGAVDWGGGVIQPGSLGSEKIHVVAFDNGNHALWQKTGGGQGNYPGAISVSPQNEVYFTSAVTDTCTFDTITVNIGNNLATVVVKIIPSSVGLEEITGKILSVYPNPASGHINIPLEWAGKLINIYSMDGKLIKSVNTQGTLVSTSGLSNGSYILKCEGTISRVTILND